MEKAGKEEKNFKELLVKGSFWALLASVISRLGALIFTIILARFLLPEGYGIYSIVLSVSMIFFTFTDLGVNSALIRYVSHTLTKNKSKAHSYYSYLLKIKFLLTLLVSFVLAILAPVISLYVFNNPLLKMPLMISAFYIFILSIESFYASIFYIAKKISYISIREVLNQTLRIIFALGVFYFVSSSFYVSGLFISFIFVSFILTMFSLFYTKRLIPEIFEKTSFETIEKVRILKFIGLITIASISSIFFSYIDSIMLGIFLKPEFVGYYKAAFALIAGVSSILFAPISILLPIFTNLSKIKLRLSVNNISKYLTIFTIPSSFGILVLGKYFLRSFYGYSYLPASLPLSFLAFLLIPSLYVSIFLSLFSAKEKPEIFAKLLIFASILNIILNYIFIKTLLNISEIWATAGAAIATLISWLVYSCLSFYHAKKEIGIKFSFAYLVKPLIASIVMAGFLLCTSRLIEDMTFIHGLLEVFAGMLVYFIIMFLLNGVTKKDFGALKILLFK
ncbi:MAG: flippase [Candidatus Nanoarchaeia archaeon]